MVLGEGVKSDSKVKKILCDFLGGELAALRAASGCCAARSAASGKRKRPPAQRKIFGFHNPHYHFPDTELSGIRARTPRQNTDFVPGISDFWRSEAVSAPQAKFLRFRTPNVSISASYRVSQRRQTECCERRCGAPSRIMSYERPAPRYEL